MLNRLIYASRCTNPLKENDIEQILEASRRHNLADGITGMLCYGNERFLQFLEGKEAVVKKIYDLIQGDSRHTDLVILDDQETEKRIFGDWSMGFVDIDNIMTEVTLLETTKMDNFYPEKMDANTALRVLNMLKSSLSDQVII